MFRKFDLKALQDLIENTAVFILRAVKGRRKVVISKTDYFVTVDEVIKNTTT